jgi:hypothetical protein
MKTKQNKTAGNYWNKLASLNIIYGRDVVLGHDIVNGNFSRCLEFRGQLFKTAKEIWITVTR